MTVFESLATWLYEILSDPKNGFEGNFMVDVEVLPETEKDGFQSTSLHSNPNDIQKQGVGGQIRHESYKTFYIRRNFIDQQTRMLNETFFEDLRKCIHERNLNADYPKDGREWYGITYQGGVYPSQKSPNNEYAIYQVTIKLTYEE
jgi:MoaA/NifB/PqqE/SkfB family radical SAM enzyme